jgi:type II secretory pathway pseudopilin PulG
MVKNPFYRRRDAGYTLVAVAIGIAILTILVAAVGPSIATIMKREREDELIFRGRQYARAIALFQRRYQRFPSTLKEMYDNRPRTIRKLWKDPMCRCDDWKLLIAGAGNQLPGTGVPGGRIPARTARRRRRLRRPAPSAIRKASRDRSWASPRRSTRKGCGSGAAASTTTNGTSWPETPTATSSEPA